MTPACHSSSVRIGPECRFAVHGGLRKWNGGIRSPFSSHEGCPSTDKHVGSSPDLLNPACLVQHADTPVFSCHSRDCFHTQDGRVRVFGDEEGVRIDPIVFARWKWATMIALTKFFPDDKQTDICRDTEGHELVPAKCVGGDGAAEVEIGVGLRGIGQARREGTWRVGRVGVCIPENPCWNANENDRWFPGSGRYWSASTEERVPAPKPADSDQETSIEDHGTRSNYSATQLHLPVTVPPYLAGAVALMLSKMKEHFKYLSSVCDSNGSGGSCLVPSCAATIEALYQPGPAALLIVAVYDTSGSTARRQPDAASQT
ncbi:hypothetical protein HD554DRAFT_2042638 [Boletus coccyginus]|nr:hypothetical protein HD554DRAFT_2042638 [Boletus coccyginus]